MLWFFIAGLLIIAVAYLLLPLFRTSGEVVDDRKEQNIQIVREQMADLEGSFERGEIDNEQYSQRRDELEQALLLDVDGASESITKPKTSTSSWLSAGFLALFVPMSAIALYLYLGTPDAQQQAIDTAQPEIPMTADGKPDIEKLVTSLHDKLRQNPDNAQGWYMLGRSYMMMQRFEGATEAYENLLRLQPEEPDVMLMLADSLSMQQQGKMAGRPEALINQALEKAPQNTTGLWLSGMALEQKGEYQAALDRWTVLRPLLKDDLQEQVQLDVLIKRAQAKLSGNESVPSPKQVKAKEPPQTENEQPAAQRSTGTDKGAVSGATVTVTVKLGDAFRDKVTPNETVFVYAKAQSGPPMPLAASRILVKDLPASLTLDDSMAMMPQMKLSMFDRVIVGARVSKSGNAVGQDGDLFVEQAQVDHGDEVELVINQVLKK